MDSINEMNDEMTKIGLPKLKKYLNQMLRAKVTIEGHAAGSAMVFIEAIFGYLRDNFAIVIRNQIDESNQRPIDNPEGHENPGYAPEYLNLMRDFASKIAWQSEEDFHASASSHMTTRSVGLFPADSVDPEVTGSPIAEDVPEFSFEYEGRKFLFKGSDKVTWYMIDPQQGILNLWTVSGNQGAPERSDYDRLDQGKREQSLWVRAPLTCVNH
jgi:hypothetical protein